MPNKPRTPESFKETNRIVEGSKIQGHVESPGDIRVDGTVLGNLSVGGKLVIGPSGSIEGDVVAQELTVNGSIKGKLNVKGLTTLTKTAKIQAELTTEKLAIEPGAQFTGTCQMGSSKPIAGAKPVAGSATEAAPQASAS